LVRAATLLVAPELAAALRDQPAVEEAIAWAAVASAVVVAVAEAAAAAEVDADDKQTNRSCGILSADLISKRRYEKNRTPFTCPGSWRSLSRAGTGHPVFTV